MGKKVVIFNRLCTGNYLDEGINLGHEVIHFFKADGTNKSDEQKEGDNYVYLLADGTYPTTRKNDEIDAIYYTKGINAGCVEVIAVASGISPVFNPCTGFSCFSGGKREYIPNADSTEEPAWRRLKKGEKKDGKDLISEINYLFEKLLSKEILSNLCKGEELGECISKNMIWLSTADFVGMSADQRDDKLKREKPSAVLVEIANKLKKKKGWNNLCKAIYRRAMHLSQLEYIIENNICYGGVRLDKLFMDNTSYKYGLSVYITYAASSVQKPKKPLYIINDESLKSVENADYITVNEKRLASTSLATYFEDSNEDALCSYKQLCYKEIEKYLKKGNDEGFEKFTSSKARKNEESFLSIIRKEHDELVFSNLFAYFFVHPEVRKVVIALLREKSKESEEKNRTAELVLSNNFGLYRELANIDILIEDEDNVVVIENKIHSGINGEIYDDEGDLVSTQLDTYRDFVKNKHELYRDKKNHWFFVFVPNYSHISQEELKGYIRVTYSELHKAFGKVKVENFDKRTKIYFEDFLNGLEIHSNSVDNQYEIIMHRRLQNLIQKINNLNTDN